MTCTADGGSGRCHGQHRVLVEADPEHLRALRALPVLTALGGDEQATEGAPLGAVHLDDVGHEPEAVDDGHLVEVLGRVLGAHRPAVVAPPSDEGALGGDGRPG